MRIPIKLNDLKESNERFPPQLVKLASNELVLIELQGALEVEGNKKGQLIGTLNLDNPDRPTLQIGYSLLEGKIVSLSKPLAVLRLVQETRNKPGSMPIDDEEIRPANDKSFEIVSIVRKKISFPKRPRPLVHHAGPS